MLATTLVIAYLLVIAAASARADSFPTPLHTLGLYRSHSASYWAWRYRVRTRQLQHANVLLHRRWHPTVDYALRLASAVTGVSYWQMRSVSYCESTHNPFATNGKYKGLFQLGWSPFGFSPFDPVANALSAALTVRNDGSWRQWQCKP